MRQKAAGRQQHHCTPAKKPSCQDANAVREEKDAGVVYELRQHHSLGGHQHRECHGKGPNIQKRHNKKWHQPVPDHRRLHRVDLAFHEVAAIFALPFSYQKVFVDKFL